MPVRMLRALPALVASAALSVCQQSASVYHAARPFPLDFGHLIDESPIVVIAVSGGKTPVGPPGFIERPRGLRPSPAQKYSFELKILMSLRGTLAGGERITVIGYEDESRVLIGPPQGICDVAGAEGIYFLERINGEFRPMADVYRTWVPLDTGTKLSLAGERDIPLSIWLLLVYPYEVGLRPAARIDFSSIEQATGYRLGRARTVELLSDLANHPRNADLGLAACYYLNEAHRGCGGEGCLTRILTDSSRHLGEGTEAALQRELADVPESNALLEAALGQRGDKGIALWARSSDPDEVRRFLTLLLKHPDARIVELAKRRLAALAAELF